MIVAEDSEFWDRLARRINDALRTSRDNDIRFLWVDGFVPGSISPDIDHDAVLTKAFVSEDDGRSFIPYQIRLHLDQSTFLACSKGDWDHRLPPSGATEWLTVGQRSKTIEIKCASLKHGC